MGVQYDTLPPSPFFSFFFRVRWLFAGKFADIWQYQRTGISMTKFLKYEFILKVTFSLASPSSMLKLPINSWERALVPLPLQRGLNKSQCIDCPQKWPF